MEKVIKWKSNVENSKRELGCNSVYRMLAKYVQVQKLIPSTVET